MAPTLASRLQKRQVLRLEALDPGAGVRRQGRIHGERVGGQQGKAPPREEGRHKISSAGERLPRDGAIELHTPTLSRYFPKFPVPASHFILNLPSFLAQPTHPSSIQMLYLFLLY